MSRHFVKRPVLANSVSSQIPASLDNFLQDFAQTYGDLTYNDIIEFGKHATAETVKDLKKKVASLKRIMREMGCDLYEAAQEDDEVAELCQDIGNIIKSTISAN